MKLWLLNRTDPETDGGGWWDSYFGFILKAESVEIARTLAQEENDGVLGNLDEPPPTVAVWLDSTKTTCVELTPELETESPIIMADFMAG